MGNFRGKGLTDIRSKIAFFGFTSIRSEENFIFTHYFL